MCPFSSVSFLGVVVSLLVVLYTYYKWKFQYWKKKNIPYVEPSIPFGNFPNPLTRKQPVTERIRDIYNHFRKLGVKHGGFYAFAKPHYMPVDPEYIKNIMTKDFAHFTDRGGFVNEKSEPLTAHLFSIGGTKWRNLRVKLTPTFTTGKMKTMFMTLKDCGRNFKEMMDGIVDQNVPLDIKELTARFTTDVIGTCAFGLECHSIADENSPFRIYGRKLFQLTKFRQLLTAIAITNPKLGRFFNIKVLEDDVSHFFMNVVKTTVEYREKNDYRRNDFLQTLIDLKNNNSGDEIIGEQDGKSLTVEEIAAQCFIFYIGGFETSSTLLTFTMLELCKNTTIQEKAREEVIAVLKKYNDEITYDAVMEMKYVRQVLDESLRMYPPLPALTRECVKDYKVPDADLVIETGTKCWISVVGIHHDEKYYPKPEVFDPERFSEENRRKIQQHTYLPFGEGPRNCIGLRFGYMQATVALSILLKNYRFTLDPQMKLPVELDPASFITSAKGGVWLRAERIKLFL